MSAAGQHVMTGPDLALEAGAQKFERTDREKSGTHRHITYNQHGKVPASMGLLLHADLGCTDEARRLARTLTWVHEFILLYLINF
jgi:hypothetical protein